MSTLGSKQFTESDFFFLIESFTIFYEKMLSYYENEGKKLANNHWVQFKSKLMDKNVTTSQIFAFCNNIKVTPNNSTSETKPISNTQPNSNTSNNNTYNITNMMSSKDSNKSQNQQQSDSKTNSPQIQPFSVNNLINQAQKRGSGEIQYRGTGYLAGTSAQQQIPSTLSSKNQGQQPNKYDSKVATKVVDLKSFSPSTNQPLNAYKLETNSQQKSDQKSQHYLKNIEEKEKQGIQTNQAFDAKGNKIQQNQQQQIQPQSVRQKDESQARMRKESRKNTRLLQKQRSRTLSIDQFQAKLALAEHDAMDDDINEQINHYQKHGEVGYQKRLEELRTKSPITSQQFTYPKKKDMMNEDFQEAVIERIQGQDLVQKQQQNQQSLPQTQHQNYQLSQNKTQDQNQNQHQTSKQQQQEKEELDKIRTKQISFNNLSSLKTKKPSFSSARKDELFLKVKQGIEIIKKNTTTLTLVSDKSFEIDTTKHTHSQQPKFGQHQHHDYQNRHNTFQNQGGHPQHQNHHQPPQHHQNFTQNNNKYPQAQNVKKSTNMKKYSIFLKAENDQNQQQQQQHAPPSQYSNQQNYRPQEKVTITTTTTINKPGQPKTATTNTTQGYNNNGTSSNPVYKKLEQVYNNPSQYVNQYNSKKYHYQGGKVIL